MDAKSKKYFKKSSETGKNLAAKAQKSDRPKSDRPKTDARSFDRPKSDRPKTDVRNFDRPKASAADARSFDRPKTDARSFDRPGMNAADPRRPARSLENSPETRRTERPVSNPKDSRLPARSFEKKPEFRKPGRPVSNSADSRRPVRAYEKRAEPGRSDRPMLNQADSRIQDLQTPHFDEFRNIPQEDMKSAAVPNEISEPVASADRLEGRNPVLEALRAGRTMNKLWVAKLDGGRIDPTVARILTLAKEQHVLILEVPRLSLDQMSETHNHQGVIAQVASHDYEDLDQIILRARENGEVPFLLMLDELKDAYNIGSILRIADAAGIHGVIIPKHRSIGLDSLVAKASAGAIEYVPVARVNNLSQTISELKDDGFWVAGTDAEGTTPYNKADFKGPLLIVIGSEGEGMNKNIREKCDFLLSIPMAGRVNSLNAAVAAGIVVFEAQRQRSSAQEKK